MFVNSDYCLYLHPFKTSLCFKQLYQRRGGPEVSVIDTQKNNQNAGVVELVDTLDLGSSAARCESSSLSARTTQNLNNLIVRLLRFFYVCHVRILY